jgi:hypothetical protein
MAIRTVFTDEDNNEMDCYLNDKGKVYIRVGEPGEDITYSGYITLDKDDVTQLIKKLTELEAEMEV